MIEDTTVRSFDTPTVAGVDGVTIHYTNAKNMDKPLYATQYYHRDTFEDGTKWYHEPDEYVTGPDYRKAVAENTHVPIEDIRLEQLPTEPTYVF